MTPAISRCVRLPVPARQLPIPVNAGREDLLRADDGTRAYAPAAAVATTVAAGRAVGGVARAQNRPRRRQLAPARTTLGAGVALVVGLWIVVVFDPHWLLAAYGPGAVLKLPVLLNASVLASLLLGLLAYAAVRQRWQWYLPYLLYLSSAVVTLPIVLNIGYTRDGLLWLWTWWVFIVATVALVDSVRRTELLLLLYALQFVWWGVWGVMGGLVPWHPTLSNYDGFGAVNVGGVAICYFFALAFPAGRFRWLLYATTALCALGVVASFARGAFLATLFVFAVIWIRSPHKLRTLGAGIGAAILMVIAVSLLFDDGFFMAEIMSTFEEGVSEGTGADRWILWGAAWRVFLENPVFGAGLRNWGVVAADLFEHGDLGGQYSNPGALYNMSLHNLYMTTLSELGIVGSAALVWILVDFFRRNAALRTEAAQLRWRALGGRLSLKHISLGLESSMVAFLVNAMFYSMMGNHWFYTALALNLLLHSLAVRSAVPHHAAPRAVRVQPRALAPQSVIQRRSPGT